MPTIRQISAAVPLALCFAIGPVLHAADVLEAIPDTALAILLVNRLEETSDKIERLAKQVHAPVVSVLTMTRVQTGMHAGFDEKGSAALALLPGKDSNLRPQAVIFLPVTDYDKFLAQLQPTDAAKPIAEVRLIGRPMLICKHAGCAAIADPDAQAALEGVLSSVKDVSSAMSPLKTWLGEVDAAAVATPAGIKLATEQAQALLPLVKMGLQSFAQQQQPAGQQQAAQQQAAQAHTMAQTFDLLERGLKAFQAEVTHVALAVQTDESANLRLTARVRLAPGGQWTAAAKSLEPPTEGLLAGLPGGSFAAVYGLTLPKPWREVCGTQIATLMKINPLFNRLPEEQQAKLSLAIVELFEPIQSMSLFMGAPKAGDPLYANMMGLMKVDDANKYLEQYREAVHLLSEAIQIPQGALPKYEVKKIDVDGQPVLDITTDLSKFTLPGAADIKPMFEKMFGPGDKIHTYLAVADNQTVVLSYVNVESLQRALASAKIPGEGLAAEPRVAETAKLLPSGAQWLAYVQPQGAIDLAQSILAIIPGAVPPLQLSEIRPSPPIGMTGKLAPSGLDVDVVAPAPTLEAIGEFVGKLRGLR